MKFKTIVSTMMLGSIVLSTAMPAAMAADKADTNSRVKATVKTGGMTLEADTVDLGKLEIGKKIDNVDGEVRITDYTGGAGWDLSVKSTNYDKVNPSLVEKVKVGDGSESLLLPNDTKVDNGPSLLETQKRKATYSAEWGVAPVAGGVNNELTWTLTPTIPVEKTIAEIVKENVVWASQGATNIYDTTRRSDNEIDVSDIYPGVEIQGVERGLVSKINENNELVFVTDMSYSYTQEPSLGEYSIESAKDYYYAGLEIVPGSENRKVLDFDGATWVSSIAGYESVSGYYSDELSELLSESVVGEGNDPSSMSIDKDGTLVLAGFSIVDHMTGVLSSNNREATENIRMNFVDGSVLEFKLIHKAINEIEFNSER